MGKLYRPSLDQRVGDKDEYFMPPCTKVDPEIFFEHKSRFKAQEICLSCPIKKTCLRTVMHQESDPGGVYGALTAKNRDHLRKRLECQSIGS